MNEFRWVLINAEDTALLKLFDEVVRQIKSKRRLEAPADVSLAVLENTKDSISIELQARGWVNDWILK